MITTIHLELALLAAVPAIGQQNAGAPATGKPASVPAPAAAHAAARAAEDSRKELAERVGKAHRGDDKTAIDRLKAELTLESKGEKGNVDVNLKVIYGAKVERAKGVTSEMVRFWVQEGAEPLERGKDPRPWHKIGKRVESLGMTRENATDVKLLDDHTALCRQMLQFLDPGAILRNLEGDEPVREVKLRMASGKDGMIDADLIRGRLAAFPLARGEGRDLQQRAVFLEAWIDRKTSLLAAILVRPLGQDGKPLPEGEFIAMRDYTTSNGVKLPKELLFYEISGPRREPRATVKLISVTLNAKLGLDDFARPKS